MSLNHKVGATAVVTNKGFLGEDWLLVRGRSWEMSLYTTTVFLTSTKRHPLQTIIRPSKLKSRLSFLLSASEITSVTGGEEKLAEMFESQ